MALSRRTVTLGAALALTVGLAVWTRSDQPPTTAGSSQSSPDRARQNRSGARDGGEPVEVNLEPLRGERQGPGTGSRNPFQFEARAPRPPSAAESFGVPPSPVPAPPPTPTEPPVPPITLKFIGTVQKTDGVKVAMLTGGTYPLYGREGEIVDGRYRILRIGAESIDIAYVDGRGRQTIRLTGQ